MSRGCKVQDGNCSWKHCMAYLKVTRKEDLKSSHHKEKIIILCMVPPCWVQSLQSGLTLLDSMDCSPPGSSGHGIFQARVLERVVVPFSRGSSWPRDQTSVSCIARGFLTAEPLGKTNLTRSWRQKLCKWSCIITILIIRNLKKSLMFTLN